MIENRDTSAAVAASFSSNLTRSVVGLSGTAARRTGGAWSSNGVNGVIVPGERWDERAKPMLDYFMAFQESFNRFPGFNYEVQGVYQEREEGRIRFYTYVVKQ